MHCLVISDSHRSPENIGRALDRCRGAEVVFYLGDGISELEPYVDAHPEIAWIYVLGNCDSPTVIRNTPVKKVESITLFGHRIVLTHGDLYGAKYGLGGLLALAKTEHADLVLFGHTHIPSEDRTADGITLFNPGALERGFASPPSFGVITFDKEGRMLLSHGTL